MDVVMSELDFPEEDTLYSGNRDAALTAIHHEESWDGTRALLSDILEDSALIQPCTCARRWGGS